MKWTEEKIDRHITYAGMLFKQMEVERMLGNTKKESLIRAAVKELEQLISAVYEAPSTFLMSPEEVV